MKVKSGVAPEAVNQGARHTLFVEGSNQDAIDPRALTRLLRDTDITVKALGSSFYLKSAAQALHAHHQNYYFLIDRDHHDDFEVNETWTAFPNPDKHNLLIWRKRALENYFLDPDYLSRSTFLTKCKPDELKNRLLKFSAQRIFFDLANQTIVKIRESQKETWITEFTDPADFKTDSKALEQLKLCSAFTARATSVSKQVKFELVEKTFRELEAQFLNGTAKPQFGEGDWLNKMLGKPILRSLINDCFRVTDADGNILHGPAAVTTVAEELLTGDLISQPLDFQQLHRLITAQVRIKVQP